MCHISQPIVVRGSTALPWMAAITRSASKSTTHSLSPKGVGVWHSARPRTPHDPAMGSQNSSASLRPCQARWSVKCSMTRIVCSKVSARFSGTGPTIRLLAALWQGADRDRDKDGQADHERTPPDLRATRSDYDVVM